MTPRSFRDDRDIVLIHGLLREIARQAPGSDCLSIGDFEWWQVNDDDPDALQNSALWFDDDDMLVAFTWPSGANLDYVIHPDRSDLETMILDDWLSTEEEVPSVASVHCPEGNLVRVEALESCGFVASKRAYTCWSQELSAPDNAAPPPAGYTIRAFAGENEIESRVAAHRSAFHPSRMTVEKHRRAMRSPVYRRDLDLVAVASNGTIAAYALVWFDPVNRTGLFEPVGTHADHRRRGLARRVIQEGLGRLWELGASTAFVNSGYDNEATNALYASCGFQVADVETIWERSQET